MSCIGIDLGTTYSCVGVYRDNRVEIIANDTGSRITPSWVSFESSEILVGESAKSNFIKNPSNTFYDAKRFIGRKYEECLFLSRYSFKTHQDLHNQIQFEVNHNNKLEYMYPEEISSIILQKMKSIAEDYLNYPVANAVITVPAYFNDAQRNATKLAGELAGLNVLRIINEPTAAAIAYGLDKDSSKLKHILIFDCGGGTTDVSILTLEDGVFRVLTCSGDNNLGGEDFDEKLKLYCLYEFGRRNNMSITQVNNLILNNSRYLSKMSRLKKECENAKCVLSLSTSTTICVDSFYEDKDLIIDITRAKFENICNNEFNRLTKPIMDALRECDLKPEHIDDIILIGGSTRIPKIKQVIKDIFNKNPHDDINPDETVAYGATLQGAILTEEDNKQLSSIVLIDALPMSIGVEVTGGLVVPIIKKNTPIPCESEKVFSTYSDNQPSIKLKIYEGERPMARDNNLLGEYEMNINPYAKNMARIHVKFKIDINNIINITAWDEKDNANKLTITNVHNNIINDKKIKMIRDSELNFEEDTKTLENIMAYDRLNRLLLNIQKTEDNFKIINNYIEWINMHKNENCDIYNKIYNELIELNLSKETSI